MNQKKKYILITAQVVLTNTLSLHYIHKQRISLSRCKKNFQFLTIQNYIENGPKDLKYLYVITLNKKQYHHDWFVFFPVETIYWVHS